MKPWPSSTNRPPTIRHLRVGVGRSTRQALPDHERQPAPRAGSGKLASSDATLRVRASSSFGRFRGISTNGQPSAMTRSRCSTEFCSRQTRSTRTPHLTDSRPCGAGSNSNGSFSCRLRGARNERDQLRDSRTLHGVSAAGLHRPGLLRALSHCLPATFIGDHDKGSILVVCLGRKVVLHRRNTVLFAAAAPATSGSPGSRT